MGLQLSCFDLAGFYFYFRLLYSNAFYAKRRQAIPSVVLGRLTRPGFSRNFLNSTLISSSFASTSQLHSVTEKKKKLEAISARFHIEMRFVYIYVPLISFTFPNLTNSKCTRRFTNIQRNYLVRHNFSVLILSVQSKL